MARLPTIGLEQPSSVGQAYGGIAAILSGLAFCGIVVSIGFQWQQNRLQQRTVVRTRQFDLIKLLLDNPAYASAFGIYESPVVGLLVNLHISQFWLVWDLGETDEETMRTELRHMFRSHDALNWWKTVGSETWQAFRLRGSLEFARIVDEVANEPGLGKAVHTSPLAGLVPRKDLGESFIMPNSTPRHSRSPATALSFGAGLAAGMVIGLRLRQHDGEASLTHRHFAASAASRLPRKV